ncbi:hypothetical protein ACJX0J_015781, partial [Zea mays]
TLPTFDYNETHVEQPFAAMEPPRYCIHWISMYLSLVLQLCAFGINANSKVYTEEKWTERVLREQKRKKNPPLLRRWHALVFYCLLSWICFIWCCMHGVHQAFNKKMRSMRKACLGANGLILAKLMSLVNDALYPQGGF